MRTDSWLLDTNIVIFLLKCNKVISKIISGHECHISFVTEIELLSYRNTTDADLNEIKDFIDSVIVLDYEPELKQRVIHLRRTFGLKFADAVIAATSQYQDLPFLSADLAFERVGDPRFYYYRPRPTD